jgi:hypothetical protein
MGKIIRFEIFNIRLEISSAANHSKMKVAKISIGTQQEYK